MNNSFCKLLILMICMAYNNIIMGQATSQATGANNKNWTIKSNFVGSGDDARIELIGTSGSGYGNLNFNTGYELNQFYGLNGNATFNISKDFRVNMNGFTQEAPVVFLVEIIDLNLVLEFRNQKRNYI